VDWSRGHIKGGDDKHKGIRLVPARGKKYNLPSKKVEKRNP